MGRNTDRGKVAYSWISPDPAKAGPTLGVVVVVVCPSTSDRCLYSLKSHRALNHFKFLDELGI